jgi:hypothetical protein
VEALYALHGCKAHPVYASVVAEAECDGGNVRVASRADRLCIFRAMLKLMPAENRLSVASKLAQDVLGAVVDELLPVASAVRLLLHRSCRSRGRCCASDGSDALHPPPPLATTSHSPHCWPPCVSRMDRCWTRLWPL